MKQEELARITAQRDSLEAFLNQKAIESEQYREAVEVMNSTLDSIAMLDNILFMQNRETSRNTISRNLKKYEAILENQNERIRILEAKLKESNDSTNSALKMIERLKVLVDEKNEQIDRMQRELSQSRTQLALMQTKVEEQSREIEGLNVKSEMQQNALAVQDSLLNSGYVLIAQRSFLRENGLMKQGRLVSSAEVDYSLFTSVDIRYWTEETFSARRAKVLSNMPSSSYSLTKNEDGSFTIQVVDAPAFWKSSNCLIIQTD